MYRIEIPSTIHQLMTIFYRLGMWTRSDTTTLREFCRKLFYFIYFVSFFLSVAIGALTTDDNDECVFLTVISTILMVQAYRMWIILWGGSRLMLLVNQIGVHSTNDRKEFVHLNRRLNVLMKFIRYFLVAIALTAFFGTIFPITSITSEKHLMLNIAFPLDRKRSEIAFWMSSAFVGGGIFGSLICVFLTITIWYLMMNISFEYKILGNQLRHMGAMRADVPQLKVSLAAQQQLFYEDFIVANQTYDKINGMLEEFASYFGNLFFLQIATGSVCICGSVYTLAFSSHEDMIQDGFYCSALTYSIFDIFMVMYLGNEIKLSSDEMSQCVNESNWIEQTQKCKKCIIILTERLKRPQELIVGKLYQLNLQTFTSILNGAYSLFNILQNFR